MGSWIAIIVIAAAAVIAVVAAALLLRRRRRSVPATADPTSSPRTPAPPARPMNGLESALAQVTDRDGRPIKERIDAESAHVDPLRDPDDTGPLLRRALDSVVHHEGDPAGGQPDPRPSDP